MSEQLKSIGETGSEWGITRPLEQHKIQTTPQYILTFWQDQELMGCMQLGYQEAVDMLAVLVKEGYTVQLKQGGRK